MLKSVFFRRLVIMLSVAMLIAAAVMLGGYVFLSKDVYADIKLDELHPSLDAAEQLAKEYMAGEIDKDVFERLAAKLHYRDTDAQKSAYPPGCGKHRQAHDSTVVLIAKA